MSHIRMARQTVAGSTRQRRAIAVRPTQPETDEIQRLADQWQCSLGQATLRLVRIGLQKPEQSQPSDRAVLVKAFLEKGHCVHETTKFAVNTWGLTHTQARQLIEEARMLMNKEIEQRRPQFLTDSLDRLQKYRDEAVRTAPAVPVR